MAFSGKMNIFERFYLFFYELKKKEALKNQKKLPFPVISIGNLTLGGTGKTPFTIALSKELLSRNYTPVILTRGYKGRLSGPLLVKKDMSADDVGDEPLMMAWDGLTVIKCADRYRGGIYAIEKLALQEQSRVVFILDDGFQHWSLYRDMSIILIDGYKGFGNKRLFPCGFLRSPIEEVKEADMIFITKKENEGIKTELSELSVKNTAFVPLKIKGIFDINGRELKPSGQRVFVFAGIGNFESFFNIVIQLDFRITGQKKFIDHKKYTIDTIKKICRNAKTAELILTTKKDFIKIKDKLQLIPNLYYLEVFMEIPNDAIEKILSRISVLDSSFSIQTGLH